MPRSSLGRGTCLAPTEAFHPVKEADMMWAFLAVIAAMGLALIKVRRQRKIRESRSSQIAA